MTRTGHPAEDAPHRHACPGCGRTWICGNPACPLDGLCGDCDAQQRDDWLAAHERPADNRPTTRKDRATWAC